MATAVLGRTRLAHFWWLFKLSWWHAYKDNAFGISKAAAYSALLAFFPVLTTVIAILVRANADSVARILTGLLFEVVPPGTEAMIRDNLAGRGYRPVLLLFFSGFVSLIAASGLMMSLMEGFRAAYKVQTGRTFWRQRGMAALLVFTAALPVVVASTLIVLGERGEQLIMTWIGVLERGEKLRGWVHLGAAMIRYVVALAAIVLSVASLYYLGPNLPSRRPRNVWAGAILATILWLIATIGFAWYVQNLANYNVVYGSIAAAIALLVWMYVMSIVALVGCEFNALIDNRGPAGLRVTK